MSLFNTYLHVVETLIAKKSQSMNDSQESVVYFEISFEGKFILGLLTTMQFLCFQDRESMYFT